MVKAFKSALEDLEDRRSVASIQSYHSLRGSYGGHTGAPIFGSEMRCAYTSPYLAPNDHTLSHSGPLNREYSAPPSSYFDHNQLPDHKRSSAALLQSIPESDLSFKGPSGGSGGPGDAIPMHRLHGDERFSKSASVDDPVLLAGR